MFFTHKNIQYNNTFKNINPIHDYNLNSLKSLDIYINKHI